MSESLELLDTRVSWCDDDGEGAVVGQSIRLVDGQYVHDWVGDGRDAYDQSEREYRAVEIAALGFAKQHDDVITVHNGGWDLGGASKTTCVAFLRICRAAYRAAKTSLRPWPAWAVQASAAGWKPPKGWKPE